MKEEQYNDDETSIILASRLIELRNKKGLTQSALATLSEVSRDKINFAEMRSRGRTLRPKEIVKLATALEVSTDYLLGITQTETSTINNGLADSTNKVISKWGNSTLDEVDNLINKFNEFGMIGYLQNYLIVSYIINNILTLILDMIEDRMTKRIILFNAHIQKIGFLTYYLARLRLNKMGNDTFLKVLAEDHKQEILEVEQQAGQILLYEQDKEVKVDFVAIRNIKVVLTEYKDYLKYKLDKAIELSTSEITITIEEDKAYFNKIKNFMKENKK